MMHSYHNRNYKLFSILLVFGVMYSLPLQSEEQKTVGFNEFEYKGMDPIFESVLPEGHYRNPIMAGFYPDPSICRVGDRYYLINSSFSYFPGIPIFESGDLVNWEQIGYVMDRASQLDTAGLGLSEGIFAPAISYHNGLFYVVCTQVGAGGNYYVTAEDPAGPWSDPVWLPDVGGIDPSLFFDEDGRVYLVHNDGPPNGVSKYQGHRAIYLWELDLIEGKTVAGPRLLVDGGTDLAKEPIWIEGPHLYKKDGFYYLMCAEGGTGPQHSEVIFRSRSLDEPFESLAHPILTQRDLDRDRENPVECVGHADLVQTPEGDWWAVFLGTRNYQTDFYHTGRETFLLPVSWDEDGWPMILPSGERVPFVVNAPRGSIGLREGFLDFNNTGNFEWKDDFSGSELGYEWIYPRTPDQEFVINDEKPGVRMIPLTRKLSDKVCPSYIGRRQQHTQFESKLSLQTNTLVNGVSAGLAVYQSENSWLYLGARKSNNGSLTVFVETKDQENRRLRKSIGLEQGGGIPSLDLCLRESAGMMDLWVIDAAGNETVLLSSMDSKFLSTAVAGGFVGCTVGMFARTE